MDGGECRRERVDGTPVLRGQEGKADLASSERDVGVRYTRCEVDRGRRQRVIRWDGDAQMPEAAYALVVSLEDKQKRNAIGGRR